MQSQRKGTFGVYWYTTEPTMKSRKIIVFLWIVGLIGGLTAGVLFTIEHWLAIPPSDGIAIHLVIKNQTGDEVGPFTILDEQSTISLETDYLEPFSKDSFDIITPGETWGENGIIMMDSTGRKYAVAGYFEHSIRGRVDIHVECAGIEGLSGRYRVLTNYIFSTKWYSWGYPACK